jgi:hypothetical protein
MKIALIVFASITLAHSASAAEDISKYPGLQQAIEKALYSFKDDGHGVRTGSNSAQRLGMEFDAGGVRISHPEGSVAFHLEGYAPAAPVVSGTRLEYRRGNLTEWYVNGPSGLEQGFTLASRPQRPADGPLTLSLAVSGLPLTQKEDAVDAGSVLRYAGLTAVDAEGRRFPARLQVRGHRIAIAVDDREARYPLVIDPTWTQQTKMTPSDGTNSAGFGTSVALSGGTAVVGAPYQNIGANTSQGEAYIFVQSGTTWSQQATLVASDGAAGDNFGSSVAVSGGTALIGASSHKVNSNAAQGSAYVFVQSGNSWSQQMELTASNGAANDVFGNSVALSSGTAVIGAYLHSSGTGEAYVFVQSGSTWSQQATLTASDGATSDFFGSSVAVSGDTAVVSGPQHTVNGDSTRGEAYIFVRSGASWSQQATLTASDGAPGDRFGYSVSIDGGTAVVGTFGHTVNSHLSQGAAYVFVQSGATCSQQAELTSSDGAASDHFGYSVAVSGSTAIIGAPYHKVGPYPSQGSAYVFTQSGAAWTQQAILTASDGGGYNYFGFSVAADGVTLLVGASGVYQFGAAYPFTTPASLSISATHSSPIFQSGPGVLTLTVTNTGSPTAAAATVSDTVDSAFTINSVDSGCTVSSQTVTCTLASGSSAASTSFNIYVTASASAGASISNTATLADSTDSIASASSTDTITVTSQAPLADSSFTQMALSGSTDNGGTCAGGTHTLTATDVLRNTSSGSVSNPYAANISLSGGNTLNSASASATTVGASSTVTFTFHIQLATCATFSLSFDVRGN